MRQSDRNEPPARAAWWKDFCVREALSSFVKAFRAAQRHPADSPVRQASARELGAAVKKALLHGPLVVRLGPDGPLLPGDQVAPSGVADESAVDLVLTDAEPEILRQVVDRWVERAPISTAPQSDRPADDERSEG